MRKKINSGFPLRKCVKKETQLDRISQLPDEILVYILSLLRLEDAARTNFLSKRWVDLWLSVARLDFDSPSLLNGFVGMSELEESDSDDEESDSIREIYRRKYVNWVNKVVQSSRAVGLDLFRIHFKLDKFFKNDIDKWLKFAFIRKVQRLELSLLEFVRDCSYEFSSDFFGLSKGNFSALSLSDSCGDGINSDVWLGLKSLRTLSFNCVNVCGEVLEFFLHNCPFLEHLLVRSSVCLKQLKVCGPSLALKHLEIIFCHQLESLTVCDTNIVSLRTTCGDRLVLENVPMLVDVCVAGSLTGLASGNFVAMAISWVSYCLTQLEGLTLEMQGWQVEEEVDLKVELPQLTKLKQLTLSFYMPPRRRSLIVLTSLLRASPNLEKFVLKSITGRMISRRVMAPKKHRDPIVLPLKHLKIIEFLGYYGRRVNEELLEFFVKNGVALKRVVIDARDHPQHSPPIDNFPEEGSYYKKLAKYQLRRLLPRHVELVFL